MAILNLADDVRLGASKADAIYVGGKRVWPWRPLDLWDGGQDGFWWDFQDFSTLFQDIDGTPCTAAGQPIGMLLDKHLGGAVSENLYPGFKFDGPNTATAGGATRTADTFTTGAGPGGVRINNITVGRVYRLRVRASFTAVVAGMYADGSAIRNLINLQSGITAERVFYATDNNLYFRNAGAGTFTLEFFELREVPGHHIYQPTSPARATLQQDEYGKYYVKPDGTDDIYAISSPIALDYSIIGAGIAITNARKGNACLLSGGAGGYIRMNAVGIWSRYNSNTGLASKDRQSILIEPAGNLTTIRDSRGNSAETGDVGGSVGLANTKWFAGFSDTTTSAAFNQGIYGMIARVGPTTETERRQVLRYLDSLLGEVTP